MLLTACGAEDAAPAAEEPGDAADPAESADPAAGAEWDPPGEITFIVHATAGGGYDSIARAMAPEIEKILPDTQVMVENHPGSGGIIALDQLVRSEPDGSTIAMIPNPTWVLQEQERPLDVDMSTLGPLGGLEVQPYGVFLSTAAGRYATWDEVRDSAETVRIGVAGTSPVIIGVAKDLDDHGTDFTVGRFDGQSEATLAAIAGDIDVVIGAASGPLLEEVSAGTLSAAFVFAQERESTLPDTPTHGELGMPQEWEAMRLYRIFATGPGVPQEALEGMSSVVEEVIAGQAFQQFASDAGLGSTFVPASEFDRMTTDLVEIFESLPDYVDEYYLD